MDNLVQSLIKEREELIQKMTSSYQRGDAMELADLNMFISIFTELNTKKESTEEEKDQVLLDHGWTLTKGDVVIHPDGTKSSKPPLTLFDNFSAEMFKKGAKSVGRQGDRFKVTVDKFNINKIPEKYEGIPVDIYYAHHYVSNEELVKLSNNTYRFSHKPIKGTLVGYIHKNGQEIYIKDEEKSNLIDFDYENHLAKVKAKVDKIVISYEYMKS